MLYIMFLELYVRTKHDCTLITLSIARNVSRNGFIWPFHDCTQSFTLKFIHKVCRQNQIELLIQVFKASASSIQPSFIIIGKNNLCYQRYAILTLWVFFDSQMFHKKEMVRYGQHRCALLRGQLEGKANTTSGCILVYNSIPVIMVVVLCFS